jgi:hypothetical protein
LPLAYVGRWPPFFCCCFFFFLLANVFLFLPELSGSPRSAPIL